jgi:hypothetical protein
MDVQECGKSVPERAEPDCALEVSRKWPRVTTDYHGALVRLSTMRAAKKQHLLFAYVELFPRDIPLPESFTASERPWSVPGSGGDVTLRASATAMPTADALAWYEEAAGGRIMIPQDSTRSGNASQPDGAKPTGIEIVSPSYGAEPALGRFCVGESVPFAAQWHDGPRIHRLVPMEDPAEAVRQLATHSDAREWLTNNAGFDPFQFEEWLGSIALLAPDPLLSSVEHFSQERSADGSERVVLQVHWRRFEGYPEEDAAALKLVLLQRRPGGWTEVLATSFDNDGFLVADFPEPVSETGYAISCPTRGLVRLVPPTMFIGQIGMNIGVVSALLDVEIPAGGRRKPASRYKTSRITETSSVRVGEALPPSGAIRIIELQESRKRRIRMESALQRLFGAHESDKDELTEDDLVQMRAEAEGYVAGLVAGAGRRVIFVDPDFGLRELQGYALRVMRDGVAVKVLTGARRMRDTSKPGGTVVKAPPDAQEATASGGPHGVHLLKQLRHVQNQLGRAAPEVFVMPGSSKPLFHDRFIVIDDEVWTSGPSFNELGERIGMVSRVHEPQSVIAAIERVLQRSPSLADWIDQAALQNPTDGGPDVANN